MTRLGMAATLSLLSALPQMAPAQHWLLIETRDLPGQCSRPLSCIDRSTLALRNLVAVSAGERDMLLRTLNGLSTIRGLPEETTNQSMILPETMIATLHPLPKAANLDALIGHPGVFFDPTTLDADEATAGFSAFVISQLTAAGVPLLSQDEMDNTPGRPQLSVRFSPRTESAGCIIPFSVSMAVSEETVMVRNPTLKTSGSAWSGLVKENLANRNYSPMSALQELVTAFVTDWKSANP